MSRLETFDAGTLGERLRKARAAAGLTQGEAAGGIGLGRTTLVAIERGERRVRADELAKLAKLYGTSVNKLVSPTAVSVPVQAHFRAKGASSDAREQTLALLLDLAGGYVELERTVGRPMTPPVFVPEYPAAGATLAHAEDAATHFRGTLGLGQAPITNLLEVAELQLGLRVFIRGIDSQVAGAYVFHEELGGCVVLNAKHPRPRRNWSLAHELGHYVGERRSVDVVMALGSSDDRFADAFAGALLMPPAALRRRFQEIQLQGARFSPRDLILLAHEYGVSVEAMCRWLERLGLLPGQTYEALRERGLDLKVIRTVVGDPPPDERRPVPPRLLMIAAEAYYRGLESEGRLAHLLGVDRLELREFLDEVPGAAFQAFE